MAKKLERRLPTVSAPDYGCVLEFPLRLVVAMAVAARREVEGLAVERLAAGDNRDPGNLDRHHS